MFEVFGHYQQHPFPPLCKDVLRSAGRPGPGQALEPSVAGHGAGQRRPHGAEEGSQRVTVRALVVSRGSREATQGWRGQPPALLPSPPHPPPWGRLALLPPLPGALRVGPPCVGRAAHRHRGSGAPCCRLRAPSELMCGTQGKCRQSRLQGLVPGLACPADGRGLPGFLGPPGGSRILGCPLPRWWRPDVRPFPGPMGRAPVSSHSWSLSPPLSAQPPEALSPPLPTGHAAVQAR